MRSRSGTLFTEGEVVVVCWSCMHGAAAPSTMHHCMLVGAPSAAPLAASGAASAAPLLALALHWKRLLLVLDGELVEMLAADAFLHGCADGEAVIVAMRHRPTTVSDALDRVQEVLSGIHLVNGSKQDRRVRRSYLDCFGEVRKSTSKFRQLNVEDRNLHVRLDDS